jgi:hypothetical protein
MRLTLLLSLFVLSAVFASQGDFAEYFTEEASLVQKDAPIKMPPVPSSDETDQEAPIPVHGDVVEQVAALLGSETASRDMLDSEGLAQVEASSESEAKNSGFIHSSSLVKNVMKNLVGRHYKSYMSSSSSILKPGLPRNRFEGHIDDAEDAAYYKRNSLGKNRIFGDGHNSKIMKNGKVRPPGYTIDDASTGPRGHFYIGASRRRIGGGFGRRRRSHLERENKAAEREHKRLLAANYARRNARNERENKTCSFKVCPQGTPGYKRWHSSKPCTPRPQDCAKNMWCVTGKCKVIRSYASGYTSGATKSMFRAAVHAMRKHHPNGKMVKKALQRAARVMGGLKAASIAQQAKAAGMTKAQTAKLVKSKAAHKKKKRLMKLKLQRMKMIKAKREKKIKWIKMMRNKEIARAKAAGKMKRLIKMKLAKLKLAKMKKAKMKKAAKGCKVEKDIDYRGTDLKRYHKVPDATFCGNLCAANKRCKSFTWGRAKGRWYTHVCFLKHGLGKRVKMAGVDSGRPCKTKQTKQAAQKNAADLKKLVAKKCAKVHCEDSTERENEKRAIGGLCSFSNKKDIIQLMAPLVKCKRSTDCAKMCKSNGAARYQVDPHTPHGKAFIKNYWNRGKKTKKNNSFSCRKAQMPGERGDKNRYGRTIKEVAMPGKKQSSCQALCEKTRECNAFSYDVTAPNHECALYEDFNVKRAEWNTEDGNEDFNFCWLPNSHDGEIPSHD